MSDPRTRIPGVDRLLEDELVRPLLARYPRAPVVEALRVAVASARAAMMPGGDGWAQDPRDPAPYAVLAEAHLAARGRGSLRPVLNATGVVLHTNLGRAPLAPEARAAMDAVAAGYSTLEFDLDEGRRGSRYLHCAALLCDLTGAEDAVVVNNCAGALVLALNTVARGAGVVVSRGELVEIGGGFRIPDILERAGARLLEVGATNRTHVDDYRRALDEGHADAILKVHRSNFRLQGFTADVGVRALAALAAPANVALIHDVGSGLLVDPADLGLPPEPRAATSLAAGADLAVFSGDKLLGGPQAGIVVGRAELVARVRANPLCRALRVDKATLAALEATLRLYGDPATVTQRIPVLRMLTLPPEELERRGRRLVDAIGGRPGVAAVDVVAGVGRVGGGTYPDHALPAHPVRIEAVDGAEVIAARLRAGDPPVVARIDEGAVLLDLRTIDPGDDDALATALAAALREAR